MVFYIIHMMWMCICMSSYHITPALVGQAFWNDSHFWLHPKSQSTQLGAALENFHAKYVFKMFFIIFMWCGVHIVWILATLLLLKITHTSCYLLRFKPQLNVVVEVVVLFKWAPTSMLNPYKVFYIIHMMWMCICMSSYHITPALVGQAFGNLQHFWFSPER